MDIIQDLSASASSQGIEEWEESFDPQFQMAMHKFWKCHPAIHKWLTEPTELYLISGTQSYMKPGFFAYQVCSASGFGADNVLKKVVEKLVESGIVPAAKKHTDSG